ncbi:MAG: hypothetical protein HAW67_01715, partial [Endozoicomonadaceae bacterium]|nr:hypothetical protein [Endozoicomonadaceae bacterium]
MFERPQNKKPPYLLQMEAQKRQEQENATSKKQREEQRQETYKDLEIKEKEVKIQSELAKTDRTQSQSLLDKNKSYEVSTKSKLNEATAITSLEQINQDLNIAQRKPDQSIQSSPYLKGADTEEGKAIVGDPEAHPTLSPEDQEALSAQHNTPGLEGASQAISGVEGAGGAQLASGQLGGSLANKAPVESPEFTNQSSSDFQKLKAPDLTEEVENQESYLKYISKKNTEIEGLTDIYKQAIDLKNKAKEKSKARYLELQSKISNLKNEDVTYKQAVRNIPLASGALAFLSALAYGFAGHDNPTEAIDGLIEKNYQDLKTKFELKKQGLASEVTLLEKLDEFSDDEFEAKSLFYRESLNSINSSIANMLKQSTLNKNSAVLKKTQADLQNNKIMNDNRLKQTIEDKNNSQAQQKFKNSIAISSDKIARRKSDIDAFKAKKKKGGIT